MISLGAKIELLIPIIRTQILLTDLHIYLILQVVGIWYLIKLEKKAVAKIKGAR